MKEHTPLPWRVVDGDAVATGTRAVFVSPHSADPEERAASRGNAQLAVRAVNHHDELLAMLERLAGWSLNDAFARHDHHLPSVAREWLEIRKAAKAVIARVRS